MKEQPFPILEFDPDPDAVISPADWAGGARLPHRCAAVRDEGASYHYLPPGREALPDPELVAALERALAARGLPFVTGKTWTTDALYRETRGKIARRAAEGCLTVEMEAAGFFAAASFRGLQAAQLLYAADDVSGEAWAERGWRDQRGVRRALVDLCLETIAAL